MTKFLIIFSALFFCGISYTEAKTKLDNITLQWTPTTELNVFDKYNYKHLINTKIQIEKFTDARSTQNPQLIGENIEDTPDILPVKTTSDIGDFYRYGISDTFKKLGFEVTNTNPEFILGGKIIELFIKEKDTYEGTLVTKLFLKKGQKIVWEGVTTVHNTRFGRSYKLENYLEVYSDLAIETLVSLFDTEKFQDNLGIKKNALTKQDKTSLNTAAKNIELKWTPTTSLKVFEKTEYKSLLNTKIKFDKIIDERVLSTNVIGENVEKAEHPKLVVTNSDIGHFYQNGMSDVLLKLGLQITDTKPDFILTGKITHLFIKEKNTYVGALIIKMQLHKGQAVVWEDSINVENKRFGKSFKTENYLEVYSDLGIEALIKLLSNQNFKTVLLTKKDKN